jgi:hypothetical protein
VDAARDRVYLPAVGGGIEAVDLGTGERAWHAPAGGVLAGAAGDRVVAWEADPAAATRVRGVGPDAATGRVAAVSEAVVLPEWAVAVPFRVGGGHGFHATARVEGGAGRFGWAAWTRYWGGPPPPPSVRDAATRDAAGVVAIDPVTGTVTPTGRPPAEGEFFFWRRDKPPGRAADVAAGLAVAVRQAGPGDAGWDHAPPPP